MNIKDNQRALATKKKIKLALLKKLNAKPFDKISVQEICREAGINRTTFYIHFDNIRDLVRYIEMDIDHDIKKLFEDDDNSFLPITVKKLEKLIAFVHKHAPFYRILLYDFDRMAEIDNELKTLWRKEIELMFKKNPSLTEAEVEYRFDYFNAGFRGIVRQWLKKGCVESPGELARIIRDIVPI